MSSVKIWSSVQEWENSRPVIVSDFAASAAELRQYAQEIGWNYSEGEIYLPHGNRFDRDGLVFREPSGKEFSFTDPKHHFFYAQPVTLTNPDPAMKTSGGYPQTIKVILQGAVNDGKIVNSSMDSESDISATPEHKPNREGMMDAVKRSVQQHLTQ